MAELDVKRFYARLGKLHAHFTRHRSTPIWGNATCLSLMRGQLNEDQPYLKSVVLHQYLFGYELPDTILLLTLKGDVVVLATRKKCEFLKPAVDHPNDANLSLTVLQKNKADGNEQNYQTLLEYLQQSKENKVVVGALLKEFDNDAENSDTMVARWQAKLTDQTTTDVGPGLSMLFSIKDTEELDLMKKSSVLSNKLMKHGCIPKLESIIDQSQSVSHEALATELEQMIEDPSSIKLKIPKDDVQSCYFPIVQSGGKYDLKVSASSNSSTLKYDVLLVSIGARYKLYCSHLTRTFLVDPPKVVSETYETLVGMHEACQAAMQPGKSFKSVYKAAIQYLQNNQAEHLVEKLPKNLGFCMGLEFRDASLTLSAKNPTTFRAGMVVTLISGFQNLPLSTKDKAQTPSESDVKKIDTYALQISDMISVTRNGAEIMTKLHKSLTDISYTINDDDDDDDDEDDDDDDDQVAADAAYARSVASSGKNGVRTSSRLAKHQEAAQDVQEGAAIRERKQIHLMTRRNEERLRELARAHARGSDKDGDSDKPEELEAYSRPRDYPEGVQPNQVKVDMANQCVILPVCGNPVPFHISTIKNVVLPDPDNATYLRINFFTAGMALGKDAPANTAKLVQKYAPFASFIREMTFRSLDSHNLTQAFRQISELRKRARQRELREQEEANLVEQEKLVRTKNERVPRLSDLTMRPVFAGRKTQGNLEAHTNGLRFISTRSEVVDVMYNNIKYAIFQPCENEIMVLIHFHLKNPIMVGKKRQLDIQFFTEVVDASQTVDAGRRSMYDPDEMDDENRERMLRKKLNQAFKDFCKKVDAVAKRNNFSIEFDIPYRDLGFMGNPHKEMVFIQPTLNCLVNLTETPFFVVDLADVDHVHFERITYMSKAFDVVLINKDFSKPPWRIDMIDNVDKDAIQEWLTDMELTYTQGPMNLNWKSIMNTVASDDRFYMNTEEDEVTPKEAGWEFLRLYGRDDESDGDEDEDDSGYSDKADSGPESEEDEESAFDSEEEEESDFDADEELEEQGMDWEDMERQAIAEDRRRGREDGQNENQQRPRKRGSSSNPSGRRRRQQQQQQQQRKRRRQ